MFKATCMFNCTKKFRQFIIQLYSYPDTDLKICLYHCPHMKLYAEDYTLKQFLLFEICTLEICDKFVHKHSETIEDVEN